MTSFAPGTNPQYANAYSSWFFNGGPRTGSQAPKPGDFGPAASGPMTPNRAVPAPYPPTSPGTMLPAPPRPTPTPSKPGPGRPSRPMTPSQSPRPGKPQGGGFGIYSPGQAQPQQSPYASSTPYGQQPQSMNRYGPGTSPEYMQQNPDTEPFNPAGNRPAGIQRPAMLPMPEPGLRQLATKGPNGEPRGLPRPRHSPNDTLASGGGQPANRPPSLYGIYAPGATAEDINRAGSDALPSPSQPAANRPPPFRATTQNFDGTTSQMPNFQQRDAFIAQINNQLGQMQQQSQKQPGMGPPQFNFPQMWGQAGQMAQQGFRNPFAAPGYY